MPVKHSTHPWIELIEGDGKSISLNTTNRAQPGKHTAIFAVKVTPKPFKEISVWQWGFNAGALLEEALDRQQMFIESQHPQDDFTQSGPKNDRILSLRITNNPDTRVLCVSILGKVCGFSADSVRDQALAFWQELDGLLPYDYHYHTAQTRADFQEIAGQMILERCQTSESLASIQRFEGILQTGKHTLFTFDQWQASSRAHEQIWRALAAYSQPVMLNITLKPVMLLPEERQALIDIWSAAQQSKEISGNPELNIVIKQVETRYYNRFKQLRFPFLIQCHVIAPHGVPGFLKRAIGSALTHQGKTPDTEAQGYQVYSPCKEHIDIWRLQLQNLNFHLDNEDIPDRRLLRIRHMVGIKEASQIFRLPFPPREGLPNVSFA